VVIDGYVLAQVAGDFLFGFGTLFAIINPYGLAFVFLDRTAGLTEAERARIARLVAINAFAVLVVSLFAGTLILGFFGISLSALRIAGGLVVAVAGWTMLNAPPEEAESHVKGAGDFAAVRRSVFFPLTIPLTTGPGTIAASIALAANRQDAMRGVLVPYLTSLLVAAVIALTIWHAYRRAGMMARLFGQEGTRVVTRLSAFLLLCVGVEIILTGVTQVLGPLLAGGTR
jgi:multiple antibiotic resistance protein